MNKIYKVVWNVSLVISVAESIKCQTNSPLQYKPDFNFLSVQQNKKSFAITLKSLVCSMALLGATSVWADNIILCGGGIEQTDPQTGIVSCSSPGQGGGPTAQMNKNDIGVIVMGDEANHPAIASGYYTLAMMPDAQALVYGAIAIGQSSYVADSSAYGIALGMQASVQANNEASIALGFQSQVGNWHKNNAWLTNQQAPNAVLSIGAGNSVAYSNDKTRRIIHVADGYEDSDAATIGQMKMLLNNTAHYDQNKDGSINQNAMTLAGKQGTQIHNLADGVIGAGSTDAINGGQLANVQNQVSANRHDIDTLKGEIGHVGGGLVVQDKNTHNILVASTTGGKKVDMSGTQGHRVVTGVADANVAKGSSDVVTGNQLNNTNQAIVNALGGGAKFENGVAVGPKYTVGYGHQQQQVSNVADAVTALNQADQQLNHRVDDLGQQLSNAVQATNKRINDVEKNSQAAIASAIAISSLPQPVDKGSAMFAAGTGVWKGSVGVSVGMSGITEDKRIFNKSANYIWKLASTADSQGHWGGGASVGIQWR